MNCRQIDRLLYDYCDNILNPDKRSQFERHLAHCPACRKIVEEALLESSILREPCLIPDLPHDFTTRIMDKVANLPATTTKSAAHTGRIMSAKWSRHLINCVGLVAILLLVLNLPAIIKSQNIWPVAEREQIASQTAEIDTTAGSANEKMAKTYFGTRSEPIESAREDVDETQTYDNELKSPEKVSDTSDTPPLGDKLYGTQSAMVAEEAAPQILATNPIMNNETTTAEPFLLQPSNLPASYALLNKVDSHASATYTYTDDQQKKQLVINIAQLPLRASGPAASYSRGLIREETYVNQEPSPQPDMTAASGGADQALSPQSAVTASPDGDGAVSPKAAQEKVSIAADYADAANTISYEIEFDSQKYLLTISSNIAPEELESLARNLQFISPVP